MVREAEANAESDKQAQELAELKNKSETLCYSTERTIRELGEKVSESDKTRIEEKVRNLRQVVGSDELEKIKSAYTELESESHTLAEELYKSKAESAGSEGEAVQNPQTDVSESNNEEVIDAEFKEEK